MVISKHSMNLLKGEGFYAREWRIRFIAKEIKHSALLGVQIKRCRDRNREIIQRLLNQCGLQIMVPRTQFATQREVDTQWRKDVWDLFGVRLRMTWWWARCEGWRAQGKNDYLWLEEQVDGKDLNSHRESQEKRRQEFGLRHVQCEIAT